MAYYRKMNGDEPAIDQGIVHGHRITWNPDDGRFYVLDTEGDTLATFAEFRNAVQYARTH